MLALGRSKLLAIPALLETVACSAVLRRGGKVVVLGTHVMDPGAADGLAPHGSLAGEGVEVGNEGGQLRDGCILVPVHDGFLPEALLALGKQQLDERLERIGVHVVGRVRHVQFGEHGRLHVRQGPGGQGEVVGGSLEAVDVSARRVKGERIGVRGSGVL